MRDIKFRGKRLDNGEWVYGCLCCIDNEPVIVEGSMKWVDGSELYCNTFHFVIPESAGQYTGLKDKNGNEIYEGDVVEYKDLSGGLYLFREQPKTTGIIKINNLLRGIYLKGMGTFEGRKAEVIGNIYDNPELIGERHED